jgi:predicted small lipoprotein YifL
MKKIVCGLAALLLAVSLSSCGYSGFFRYPCQDPKNWETPECKPPICTATQTCPVDLIKTPQPEGTPNA